MENITTGITYITIMSQDIKPNQNQNIQKRKFQQTDDMTIQLRKSISYKKVRRQTTTMNCQ